MPEWSYDGRNKSMIARLNAGEPVAKVDALEFAEIVNRAKAPAKDRKDQRGP